MINQPGFLCRGGGDRRRAPQVRQHVSPGEATTSAARGCAAPGKPANQPEALQGRNKPLNGKALAVRAFVLPLQGKVHRGSNPGAARRLVPRRSLCPGLTCFDPTGLKNPAHR